MGDIYSFGSLEIESELLMEIFRKDDELVQLIFDEDKYYIFTNFDGNDGVSYPSYADEMIKNLDEFIDYLIMQDHEGAIVGNFESFEALMWDEDLPDKLSILEEIDENREAIKASLKSVYLSFRIEKFQDADVIVGLLNDFGHVVDAKYKGIHLEQGRAYLVYKYENGLSKWSIEAEFESDEINETIKIKYEKEFKEKY
jgi:hypothetical protein